MVYCAVVGCSSNNNKKSKNPTNCRFFCFPKANKHLCDLWVQKCFQKHKFNAATARVCSLHFCDDDYCLKEKLLQLPKNKWKLNTDAIPSLNILRPSKIPTEKEKKRDKRRENRNLLKSLGDSTVKYELELNMVKGNSMLGTDTMVSGETLVSGSENVEFDNSAGVDKTNEVATQTLSSLETHDLMEQIKKLQSENTQLKEALQLEKAESVAVGKIFTKGQLRKLKTNKQIQWSVEDITSAVSLHAGGPRSYRLLRKRGYPLPAVSTLRRWAGKINLHPGTLNIVLNLMKDTTFTKMERSCVLLFDEMKIQGSYEYDKKNDTTLPPRNYVQVIMARGICGNWKQPIFYDYDCKVTKVLLFKIITKLENIGFPVYAINSDLGGSNRWLWKSLNISELNTFFVNPVSHKRVHVFADAPHMIKLLRNHFLDSGYLLNNKIINSKPIIDLFKKTKDQDLNIAHKLSIEMLTVRGPQRQKVKYATKLFSHTISKAVSRMGTLGAFETPNNWLECSEFLKIINDWFDLFNSQIPHMDSRDRNKAYGLAMDEQDAILDNMKNMMENMRKVGSSSLLPFQRGIIIGIVSLKNLFRDLQEDFNIKYLLTYHLNQDPLEGLFSIIRAIGGLYDHPTGLQFKYRLRNYLMGRNDEIISRSANVQEEQSTVSNIPQKETIYRTETEQKTTEENDSHSEIVSRQFFSVLETVDDNSSTENNNFEEELRLDGLENLAGYIAFRLREKENIGYLPDCDDV